MVGIITLVLYMFQQLLTFGGLRKDLITALFVYFLLLKHFSYIRSLYSRPPYDHILLFLLHKVS